MPICIFYVIYGRQGLLEVKHGLAERRRGHFGNLRRKAFLKLVPYCLIPLKPWLCASQESTLSAVVFSQTLWPEQTSLLVEGLCAPGSHALTAAALLVKGLACGGLVA